MSSQELHPCFSEHRVQKCSKVRGAHVIQLLHDAHGSKLEASFGPTIHSWKEGMWWNLGNPAVCLPYCILQSYPVSNLNKTGIIWLWVGWKLRRPVNLSVSACMHSLDVLNWNLELQENSAAMWTRILRVAASSQNIPTLSWSYVILHSILSTGIPVDQCPLESGPSPQSWHIQCSGSNVHISKQQSHAPLATAKTISRGMRPNLTALPKTEKQSLWIYTASSEGLLKAWNPGKEFQNIFSVFQYSTCVDIFWATSKTSKVPHWK